MQNNTPFSRLFAMLIGLGIVAGTPAILMTLDYYMKTAEDVTVRNKALKEAVVFGSGAESKAAEDRVFHLQPHNGLLRFYVNELTNALHESSDALEKIESLHHFWEGRTDVIESARTKVEAEHEAKMAKVSREIATVKINLEKWRP